MSIKTDWNKNTNMTRGPTILITGGCGYIGSHTITCLLNSPKKFSVVVVDNLSNSSTISLDRVSEICHLTEDERKERLVCHIIDLCDEAAMRNVFESSPKFDFCIHFAGLKAVGESSKMPLKYYENNIQGSLILFRLMEEFGCRNIVFSSSATVYGAVDVMPITESAPVGLGITNPYGRTKHMLEEILKDVYKSYENAPDATPWAVTILRYFNPVGNHASGLIGEDPNGIPNNLMPYVSQVAVGRRDFLTVFGNDYDTADGTGVRDYIHVVDLAEGHLAAVEYMANKGAGLYTFNLGTGNGSSVLDMVKAMEKACGHEIKYKVGPRRTGDIATCYADPSYAEKELGWKAKRGLDEMCRDLWSWQSKNPNGFASP